MAAIVRAIGSLFSRVARRPVLRRPPVRVLLRTGRIAPPHYSIPTNLYSALSRNPVRRSVLVNAHDPVIRYKTAFSSTNPVTEAQFTRARNTLQHFRNRALQSPTPEGKRMFQRVYNNELDKTMKRFAPYFPSDFTQLPDAPRDVPLDRARVNGRGALRRIRDASARVVRRAGEAIRRGADRFALQMRNRGRALVDRTRRAFASDGLGVYSDSRREQNRALRQMQKDRIARGVELQRTIAAMPEWRPPSPSLAETSFSEAPPLSPRTGAVAKRTRPFTRDANSAPVRPPRRQRRSARAVEAEANAASRQTVQRQPVQRISADSLPKTVKRKRIRPRKLARRAGEFARNLARNWAYASVFSPKRGQ